MYSRSLENQQRLKATYPVPELVNEERRLATLKLSPGQVFLEPLHGPAHVACYPSNHIILRAPFLA